MRPNAHPMHKAFLISLTAHMLLCGAVVVLGGKLETKTPDPIVVFLADAMPGGSLADGEKAAGFQPKGGEPPPTEKKIKAKTHPGANKTDNLNRKVMESAEPPVTPTEAASNDSSSLPLSAGEGVSPGTTPSGGGASAGTGGGGFGVGSGGQGGSGGGTGRGHGTGSGDGNVLVRQYLAEHYAYIKELIMKHLKYPPMAKKMGWKGKVVVAFAIKENGNTENSKIVTSSGYEILDRNVLSVIKEVQPFPKPPARADLAIPITYILE